MPQIGKFFINSGEIDNANPTIVHIGTHVVLGNNSRIITHCPIKSYGQYPEIWIGDMVWIGHGVLILPGVSIGSCSIIGAGSVVVKSLPSNSISGGNPCKVIRKITDFELLRLFTLKKMEKTQGTVEPDFNIVTKEDLIFLGLTKTKEQIIKEE